MDSYHGYLFTSSNSKDALQWTKFVSYIYPGHLYVPFYLLNLNFPSLHFGHSGILPKSFPSAHFDASSSFVPVLAWTFKTKIKYILPKISLSRLIERRLYSSNRESYYFVCLAVMNFFIVDFELFDFFPLLFLTFYYDSDFTL